MITFRADTFPEILGFIGAGASKTSTAHDGLMQLLVQLLT